MPGRNRVTAVAAPQVSGRAGDELDRGHRGGMSLLAAWTVGSVARKLGAVVHAIGHGFAFLLVWNLGWRAASSNWACCARHDLATPYRRGGEVIQHLAGEVVAR